MLPYAKIPEAWKKENELNFPSSSFFFLPFLPSRKILCEKSNLKLKECVIRSRHMSFLIHWMSLDFFLWWYQFKSDVKSRWCGNESFLLAGHHLIYYYVDWLADIWYRYFVDLGNLRSLLWNLRLTGHVCWSSHPKSPHFPSHPMEMEMEKKILGDSKDQPSSWNFLTVQMNWILIR